MTWYAIPITNGSRIVAPLDTEQAQRMGASPAAPPADLTQRLVVLVRALAGSRKDSSA